MGPLRTVAAVTGLVLMLSACGADSPTPSPGPAAPPPATAKPKTAAVVEAAQAQPVKEEPAPFVYDREGLRDPFRPFVKLEPAKKKAKPKVFVPKTPLQRYATEELRLVGILWAKGRKAKALIEDPEGKGYVVASGTLVGDREGRIIDIRPEKVVIEERSVDLLGEENVKVVTMTLHKSEGEVSP